MEKKPPPPPKRKRRPPPPSAFDLLRGGVYRQHAEIAATDPNNPRIKPTLPRLKFCDEADAS
jgi:hypothetical protein